MRSKITSALAVLGAVTVLVLAANTVALAANGKGFLLGKTNSATKASVLKRTTNGPALGVVTKRTTDAPFVVNGKGRVTNLNADTIDGKDSSVLGTRALVWTRSGNQTGGSHTYVLNGLAPGTYLLNYEAYFNSFSGVTGEQVNCYFYETSSSNHYAAESSTSVNTAAAYPSLTGSGVMTQPAGGNLSLYCNIPNSRTWNFTQAEPLRITAIPLTTVTSKGQPAVTKQVAGRTR